MLSWERNVFFNHLDFLKLFFQFLAVLCEIALIEAGEYIFPLMNKDIFHFDVAVNKANFMNFFHEFIERILHILIFPAGNGRPRRNKKRYTI